MLLYKSCCLVRLCVCLQSNARALEETVASLKPKLEASERIEEEHCSQMKELKEQLEQQASQLKELRQHHQDARVNFSAFLPETGPFDEKSSYLLPVLAAAGGLLFLILILSLLILLWRCRRSNTDKMASIDAENIGQTSRSMKQLERLEQLESQFEKLRQHQQDARVSFSASLLESGSGMTGPGLKTTLKYEHIITNIGDAYDPNTGVFTAPVKGVYLFSVYGLGHGHKSTGTGVCLYKNHEQVLTAWSRQPKERVSVSNGASLLLEKDDKVCVKLWPKSWIYDNENNLSTFSGHLLFPM